MSALLFASAILALVRAPLTVSPNVKDGETIHGERAIRVSVTTDTAVARVEMYVNGDLRDTDTSTPYEFRIDTIAEDDGPLKLRFKAYTVESKTAEKGLTLKVDNGLAKGAPYHVEQANALLTDAKYAEARDEGNIARKIDKKDPGARLALARAYLGLGELDQAQLQAEEARDLKPNDPVGLTLLAGIDARRALSVSAKPGADRAETLKSIKDAFAEAAKNRKAALDAIVDGMAPDPANPVPYADAALRARRYSAAIDALRPAFEKDQKNTEIGDRLAYAQLRTNRRQDALATLNAMVRAGGLDAYGHALKAATLAAGGDDAGSDAEMREAILADSENLGVRTAQAYIALKRGQASDVARLSADLQKEQGQRPDVRYYQMAVAARAQDYSAAGKAFGVGVLAEPASADLYVEYANDALAITQRSSMDAKEKAQHYAEARVYFETALIARPEAAEALAGLAMVAAFEGKGAEAVKYASAAAAAAPNDPGAQYALAAAQALYATSLRGTDPNGASKASAAAQAANARAGRLDPKYLGGREIPNAAAVYRYLGTAGRPLVIAAPGA